MRERVEEMARMRRGNEQKWPSKHSAAALGLTFAMSACISRTKTETVTTWDDVQRWAEIQKLARVTY